MPIEKTSVRRKRGLSIERHCPTISCSHSPFRKQEDSRCRGWVGCSAGAKGCGRCNCPDGGLHAPGRRIIAELLPQRPASAETLAESVRLLGPYMSTLGASTGQMIGQ